MTKARTMTEMKCWCEGEKRHFLMFEKSLAVIYPVVNFSEWVQLLIFLLLPLLTSCQTWLPRWMPCHLVSKSHAAQVSILVCVCFQLAYHSCPPFALTLEYPIHLQIFIAIMIYLQHALHLISSMINLIYVNKHTKALKMLGRETELSTQSWRNHSF